MSALIVNDEDLTLYALRLLPSAESAPIARHLQESAFDRQRLADIELTLGTFAEAAVELHEVPQQSLDRLQAAIAAERDVLVMPQRSSVARREGRSVFDIFAWTGWAVAAMFALVVVGHYIPRQSQLARQLAMVSGEAQQSSSAAGKLVSERDALQHTLRERDRQVASVQHEASSAEEQAAALRAKADSASVQAAKEGARASDLAADAEAAKRERDTLEARLRLQSAENAQSAVTSAEAKSIMAALSDPTALQVSLTVPKKKLNPTGRGTYVASTGTLIFTGSNLPPVKSNKVYELWLMPKDGSAPLPAGTFVPDATGNATVLTARFQKGIAAKGFAITIENAGGSPTPTLPILLASS